MSECGVDPRTGRCTNTGKTKRGSCVRNQKTRRCRKRVKTRIQRIKVNSCSQGKMRNPKTNRCISKTGTIASKLLITKETQVIGGAVALDYYEFEFNGVKRHILLMGDEHTTYSYPAEKNAITIPTLLKKIIRKSSHCIDLFVENIVHQRQDLATGRHQSNYSSPLQAVRMEFGGCPTHDKDKCLYDNLRYHNWDLRFYLRKEGVPTTTQSGIWVANPYDELLLGPPSNIWKIYDSFSNKSLVLYLLGFPLPKKQKDKLDRRFDAEFKKVDGSVWRENVAPKEFQRYREKVIQRTYRKMMGRVTFPKDFLGTYLTMTRTFKDTLDFTNIFTDFYLLCRMFSKFDNTKIKNDRGPKRCKGCTVPQYMIVYAGDDHNTKVSDFLKRMFGVKPVFRTDHLHGNKKITLDDIVSKNNYETIDDLFRPYTTLPETSEDQSA